MEKVDVAVRSSATAEDLPDASLPVRNLFKRFRRKIFLESTKKYFAFYRQAISIRADKVFSF